MQYPVPRAMPARRKLDTRRKRPASANRPVPPATARTAMRTEQTSVSDPGLAGFTTRVHRVLDTVERLIRDRKFGNDPVTAIRRAEVARKFLYAAEMEKAAMGGSMDFDKVRAPALPGSPPNDAAMKASNLLNQARNKLYHGHYVVIELVVCEGWRIVEVARLQHPHEIVTRAHVDQTGWQFREGLDVLADMWIGRLPEKGALRTYRPGSAVPEAGAAGCYAEPSRTAHASRDKVRYSDDD